MLLNQIRILHVLSNVVNGSGVSNVLMNYYRNIDKEQIQFDFLCFNNVDTTLADEIKSYGGHVYLVKRPSFNRQSFQSWNKFFEKYGMQYDIVHNSQIYLTSFVKYFTYKYTKAKLIMHEHATQWGNRPTASLRNYLLTISSYGFADAYFACSRPAFEFAFQRKENFFKNKPSFIMNNAIDLKKFDYDVNIRKVMREYFKIPDGAFVIGHVGRFELEKNHLYLLRVFQEVLNRCPNSVLLLVGNGSLQSKVIQKTKEMGIRDRVIFAGEVSNVSDFYQLMDVFVLPSKFEGLGMVCVEAEAAGLPVFCSNVVPSLVNIVNCSFLDIHDTASSWAGKIMAARKFERKSTLFKMQNSIFDIHQECQKLENEYHFLIGR